MNNTKLLGIPLDLGADNISVSIGPTAFRYQQIKQKLQTSGLSVEDLGNITCPSRENLKITNPKLKYKKEIIKVSEESAKKIHQIISSKDKAIVLGGDHSISIGAVSGASAAVSGDLGIIYFDAHGDMNTDKTTSTGNIHGMPLAALMGFGDHDLTTIYNNSTKIQKQNLLHIAANELDQEEIDLIKAQNLTTYKMFDVLAYGLAPLFKLIDELQTQVKNIWVSLDLDAIDSTYAPGAGMRNKSGLTFREVTTIAKYIGEHCNIIGVDVVEYNPLQDKEGITAELAIELISNFLGHNYSWYSTYLEKNKLK